MVLRVIAAVGIMHVGYTEVPLIWQHSVLHAVVIACSLGITVISLIERAAGVKS